MKKSIIIALIIILLIIVIGVVTYFYIKENSDSTLTNNNTYISDKNLLNEDKVYSIKSKDFYLNEDEEQVDDLEEDRGMKLLEYDNTASDYAEIYYIFYDYSVEPSFYYSIEITDEKNKSVLLEEYEQLTCGEVASVKIKKLSLNQTINISIFEKYEETNKISKSSEIQIDLINDLEEKVKIDQSADLKNGKLGDINFKYVDSEYVYFGTTSHSFSENLVGETSSLPIKMQYGNYLITGEYIEFLYDKNVNNLNLEDAFESLALITETVGQYGLSDIYGMDIVDENGEITDTVTITFEDMINLCNGLTITKDGKKYTKDSFETYAEIPIVKDEEVELIEGIPAIKYHYENGEEEEEYMFVYNGNIYQMKLPVNSRINSEIQDFLDSLEIDD
jgi:hypothetical protein